MSLIERLKGSVPAHVVKRLKRLRARMRFGRQFGYGLNGLDRKLLRYLPDRPGFFIEAGANDGVTQSNTYFLEKYRGWRGLLIEPIPHRFIACHRSRPASTVACAALVPFGYSEKTVTLRYCDLMTVTEEDPGAAHGLSGEAERRAHVERGRRFLDGDPVFLFPAFARTLSSLIDEHAPDREIDLLSLDLEGFELSALMGLDMERHRPRLILIECRDFNRVRAHLARWYRLESALSVHDFLFVRR